jgi:hypothetical protein
MNRWKGLLRGSPFLLAATLALAQAETRQLRLHARDGSSVAIGQLHLTPAAEGGWHFRLALDTAVFTDHFLSMREFKCLAGASEILCHVPYPYAQPGRVSAGDTAWLEHALLFMFKKPGEFGARLWNGVYWQLEPTAAGWVGRPQAVDLNRIAAPPDRTGPPFTPAQRDPMPSGARWFERLTIE